MPYKTITAILRGEADTASLMQRIAPLVRDFGAHVTGVHAEPSPAAHVSVLAGDMVSIDETGIEAARLRMDKVNNLFEKACEREGISHEWRGMETFAGDSATASIASINATDLIVAQQIDPEQHDATFADLEALLLESGRPVLLLPCNSVAVFDPKRVVIAWKSSKEAARAVFDALPLLHRASTVEILVIDPKKSDEHSADMAGGDIAACLNRHGIAVTISHQKSAGIPVGEAITNRLSETGVDLLVMGGYGRSPVRELLFGGVTRTLLGSMPVPLFMAH